MGRIEKTIFISYRRANEPWALAVFGDLTQHGYDVFIDYDGIASGNFETAILENIKARAHFLVLLTPTALERSGDPKDWMRREIEAALDNRRNIVPLMLEGSDFGKPPVAGQLTGKLTALKEYNGISIPAGFFQEAMGRLRNKFLNVPVDAVLHPASDSAQQAAKEQKDKATMALGDEQRNPAEVQRRTEEQPREVIKSGNDESQELQPAQTPRDVDLDLATAKATPKLAFFALVVFLIAGLTKLVEWDIGWWGVFLLVGFAVVGTCLGFIPRRSVLWPAEPGSTQAKLKQSIATMRVVVSIVMVLVPVAILATSDQILASLASSVEKYLEQLNTERFVRGMVLVAVQAPVAVESSKRKVFLFVPTAARIKEGAAFNVPVTDPPLLTFQPDGQRVAGELYILQTTKLVDDIVKGLLTTFHVFATLALVVSAIFVLAIFSMEISGDLLLNRRS
jgi:hypothetical protein